MWYGQTAELAHHLKWGFMRVDSGGAPRVRGSGEPTWGATFCQEFGHRHRLMLAFEQTGRLPQKPFRFRDPSIWRRMFAIGQPENRIEHEIG
jgi:hypothetical protein